MAELLVNEEKLSAVKEYLEPLGSVLIAYSGGADSTFLLKIALEVLGRENVFAVTADSPTFPQLELENAKGIAGALGAKHMVVKTAELSNPDFFHNPKDRCYFCKIELFSKFQKIRKELGLNYCLEGSNYDDISDYRPGSRAAEELNIRSPLKETKLTKRQVRNLSRKAGLLTWNKPASACLASRIPYGQEITREKLSQIYRAEKFLADSGIRQMRVRHHGNIARIEVDEAGMALFGDDNFREKAVKLFKFLGFTYTSLDLQGYRTGSMNEALE